MCFPGDPHTEFTLVEHLERFEYFRAMSPQQLQHVAAFAHCREFITGEMLFAQGERCSGMWVIAQGRAKVLRLNEAGREHIVRLVGPGDSINDIPALDGGTNAATVIALSPVRVWMLPADVLIDAIRRDPDLALATIRILTARVRMLVQQIEDLALCSVTVRLARFLLKQQANTSLEGPGITRGTIAAHLATTPETISRALRTLEEIGAIRYDRQEIVIAHHGLLQTVAMDEHPD